MEFIILTSFKKIRKIILTRERQQMSGDTCMVVVKQESN